MYNYYELMIQAGQADYVKDRSDESLGAMILAGIILTKNISNKNSSIPGDLTAKIPDILASYINDASFTWNISGFRLEGKVIGPWVFVQQSNNAYSSEPKPILDILDKMPTQEFPKTKSLEKILEDNRKWSDRLSKEILADHDLLSVNIEELGKSFRPILQAMEGKFQTADGYTIATLAFFTIIHMNQTNAQELSVQSNGFGLVVKPQVLDQENIKGLKF